MNERGIGLGKVLPLRVDGARVLDPFVSLFGTGWSLAVNCDWRLAIGANTVATSDSEARDLTAAVESLMGKCIVRADIDQGIFDATFHFDSGERLIVIADTDLDPWVLRSDRLAQVLVGRGTDGHNEWLTQRRGEQDPI